MPLILPTSIRRYATPPPLPPDIRIAPMPRSRRPEWKYANAPIHRSGPAQGKCTEAPIGQYNSQAPEAKLRPGKTPMRPSHTPPPPSPAERKQADTPRGRAISRYAETPLWGLRYPRRKGMRRTHSSPRQRPSAPSP